MDGFIKMVKMKCGGHVAKAVEKCRGGKMKEGGSTGHEDVKEDKKLIKKAFGMHDDQQHESKTDLSGLKKGGRCKKTGGTVRKYAAGGSIDAKGKGKPIDNPEPDDCYKKGGAVAPKKAAAKSPAGKSKNTTKKFADGGLTGSNLQAILNADQIRRRRAALGGTPAPAVAAPAQPAPMGGASVPAAAPAAPQGQPMPQDTGAGAGLGAQPGGTIPGQKRGGRAGKK